MGDSSPIFLIAPTWPLGEPVASTGPACVVLEDDIDAAADAIAEDKLEKRNARLL